MSAALRWGVVFLLACRGGGPPEKAKDPERRGEAHNGGETRIVEAPATRPVAERTVSAPEVVVLFVLDTVRADHLKACGYDRPTSPAIQSLVEHGAVLSCHAYSPATWTIPSHASYFTGVAPTVHGLLNPGTPLPATYETLAETFAGAGYQTVLVAANPTLGRPSGMWQGFQVAAVSKDLHHSWRGDEVTDQVKEALSHVDPTRPLFMVVNVFDAHDPYPTVPDDVAWLPKRHTLDILPDRPNTSAEVKAWWAGKISKNDRTQLIHQMTDTYDYGVWQSDRTIRHVQEVMTAGGWLDTPWRLVVTADHGEHLGEHDLLRHDGPPWEGVAHVPLLFRDTSLATQPELPNPVSALDVYSLVKDGRLPDVPAPVTSSSIRHRADGWTGQMMDAVALWTPGGGKTLWIDGKVRTFDLTTDPTEKSPQKPADDAPLPPQLDADVKALAALQAAAASQSADPEVMKMLESVGYVN